MSNEDKPVQQPAAVAHNKHCGCPNCCVPAAGVQGDALPERDQSKPAEQQGVFRKFDVRRVDGSDAPGGRHQGCRYFVLDMDHDQHAAPALAAYASSCAATHPALSAELAAEFGQPDSGRDAALEGVEQYRVQMAAISTAAIGYWDESMTILPEYDTLALRDVAKLYTKYAALAAHPAPSSDAALVQALKDIAEACNCCGDRHDLAQIAQDALDAHPANGAQAGLSDTERMNYLCERAEFTDDGPAHTFLNCDVYFWGAETDMRKAIDIELGILAAAKKGG